MNAFALEAEGISKFFPGVKALDNVSLRVRPGTVHALMGENGAGKSTLMKCLIGIYRPDKGSIRVKGEPVEFTDTMDALRSGISMIHRGAQSGAAYDGGGEYLAGARADEVRLCRPRPADPPDPCVAG